MLANKPPYLADTKLKQEILSFKECRKRDKRRGKIVLSGCKRG
jgi:hypothetical protein